MKGRKAHVVGLLQRILHGHEGLAPVFLVPQSVDVLVFAIILWYHLQVNGKQRKTLSAILTDPVKANILWADIESLLMALGANKREGAGSRVGFTLNDVDIVIHRSHPNKEADRGAVRSVRKFLGNAGVTE